MRMTAAPAAALPNLKDDGTISVHPSPWNGKEDWHDADTAPLAGFIHFSRGEKNLLQILSEREAAIPVYNSIIQTKANAALMQRFGDYASALIENYPVWHFVSGGVPGAAEYLHDMLFSEGRKCNM